MFFDKFYFIPTVLTAFLHSTDNPFDFHVKKSLTVAIYPASLGVFFQCLFPSHLEYGFYIDLVTLA